MKTPVNGNSLRQHLTYSWWKYVLFTVLAVFGVNLYYSVTTYRPPENKKVDLYVYGYADNDALSSYMEKVQAEQMSDMEEMRAYVMTADETYGPMQLTTYIAAGEGDIYILPRDQFISMASGGAFLALDEEEELLSLFSEAGISLQSGWRKDTDLGETHLYGIPTGKLPGLNRYCAIENGFLCVMITNGNDENVLKFLRIFCEDMMSEPTE